MIDGATLEADLKSCLMGHPFSVAVCGMLGPTQLCVDALEADVDAALHILAMQPLPVAAGVMGGKLWLSES